MRWRSFDQEAGRSSILAMQLARWPNSVADPAPVEITAALGSVPKPGGHVYIQYMDLRHWNATFHAPNPSNKYYGLDPTDPNLGGGLQYAYDYTIYVPSSAQCQGKLPKKLPVFINLHGWGGNTYAPIKRFPDQYCAYGISSHRPIRDLVFWFRTPTRLSPGGRGGSRRRH